MISWLILIVNLAGEQTKQKYRKQQPFYPKRKDKVRFHSKFNQKGHKDLNF
jgi:hypothetical protein